MPICKLTPIDPNDSHWLASAHRGIAIVRVPDEEVARAEAQKAFSVTVRFKPGEGLHYPPWTRTSQVEAEIIKDDRYELDGPTEVLHPVL